MQRDLVAQAGALAEHYRDVPAIRLAAERLRLGAVERQPREQDDAVIALLPVERDVLVAEALEALHRKPVVGALGFLQTEHVRPHRFHELRDRVDAQSYRVDIPCGDGQPHRTRELVRGGTNAEAAWSPRARL